jgi:hypothetical protein
MQKDPPGSRWVSVGAGGSTFEVKAPEAHPDRPWSFEGMNVVRPTGVTIPSNRLAVGPLADARALESARPDATAFRWSELRNVDVTHLVVLRCVDEGVDPDALVEPIVEYRNPFTGEVVRRTIFRRVFESFDAIVDGDVVSSAEVGAMAADGDSFEAVVLRLPPELIGRVAQLSEPAMNDLARRWERAWRGLAEPDRRGTQPLTEELALRTLEVLVTAAKVAVAASHDVFVWMPG